MSEIPWLACNRANWNERVAVHLKSYDLAALRSGSGRLHPIEETEFHVLPGDRILHLQCHFGVDTLTLAQRGAVMTGIDFSPEAIQSARKTAAELDLHAVTFLEANIYDAPEVFPQRAAFDKVFASWGTINWLPDVRKWVAVASYYLREGGQIYLIDGHPAAYVFDDSAPSTSDMPGWFAPYFEPEALVSDDPRDYSDPHARLANARTYEWLHPLSNIVDALIASGLSIEYLHEHDAVPWQMFRQLVRGADGMYRWPEKRWLPLSFSISALKQ